MSTKKENKWGEIFIKDHPSKYFSEVYNTVMYWYLRKDYSLAIYQKHNIQGISRYLISFEMHGAFQKKRYFII